jgi:hypothetical protein
MKTYVHVWKYVAEFYVSGEMLQAKFIEKIKTHILCPIFSLHPSPPKKKHVEEYCGARQVADDNMVHAYCMLSN